MNTEQLLKTLLNSKKARLERTKKQLERINSIISDKALTIKIMNARQKVINECLNIS